MNKTEIETRLDALDRNTLTMLVRHQHGYQTVEVVEWGYEAITTGRGPATGGIYRLTGTASDHDQPVSWSMILKVLSPSASSELDDLGHPLYWKREACVYQSDMLHDLPDGLAAPHCLAVTEGPGNLVWLWLEEVKDSLGLRWPLEQFAHAAHCLGNFNGMYLTQRRIPAYSWLVRDGSPRGTLDHFAEIQRVVQNPATWQHPLVRAAFPIPVVDDLLRLWADRHKLLDSFERLPYSLCHLDAWRRNMAAPCGVAGPLVLFDWAYAGYGVIGTDAGDLLAPSYSLFGADDCTPAALDKIIFENYLEGLYGAGWQGHPSLVRFAYTAFAALKYGCLRLELADVANVDRHEQWEQLSGHPMGEFLDQQASMVYFLLELVDEARRLADLSDIWYTNP